MKVCFWKCGKASGGKIKSPLYCYNGEVLLFFVCKSDLHQLCCKDNNFFCEFVVVL